MTADRAAAPLEHRLPWLMGCSNHGSWLTQTPFWTSPMKPQPTAHLVQIVLYCSSLGGWGAPFSCASTSRESGGANAAAMPSPPIPAALRKARRSTRGFNPSSHEGEESRTLLPFVRLSFIPPPPRYTEFCSIVRYPWSGDTGSAGWH